MKLWPNSSNNSLAYTGHVGIMSNPIELNDGIYIGNVRHDKNTFTPFFNSYVPAIGRTSSTYGYSVSDRGSSSMQLWLPFSCNRGQNGNNILSRDSSSYYYYSHYCDLEWQLKGEARRKGINGYSLITADGKEHVFCSGHGGSGYGYSHLRKDKDSHLDYDTTYTTPMTYQNYYFGSCCFPMDENLQKGDPNIIVTGNGASGTSSRGWAAAHANNIGSPTWTAIQAYYSASYTYGSSYFFEYGAPQFICRSADYIVFSVSGMRRYSSGVSYYSIYRYNKSSGTITSLYNTTSYNNMQCFSTSNSITDENDPNREYFWTGVNTTTSTSSPSWTFTRFVFDKSTGTLGAVAFYPPSYTSTSAMPHYHWYDDNGGFRQRSNIVISEVGKAGVDVPSGTVDNTYATYGTNEYRVVDDSVTYDSTTYAVGKLVTGVSGEATYTGAGKLQTVSRKLISLFNTWNRGNASTTYNNYHRGWSGRIPNEDLSTAMYDGAIVDKHQAGGTGGDPAHLGSGPIDIVNGGVSSATGGLQCFCALDPYYNKILAITENNAAILEVGAGEGDYWTLVKRFPGKYQGGGMDSTGRLYLRKYDSPYELHLYTTDIPAQVSITAAKNNYTYSGTTINTLLSAQATNFEGAKVATSLKLKISGSAAEFTNGDKTITITTNTTTVNEVTFNVVAGGYFKIDAQAVSS